jgi:hypothetical protein
MEQHAAAETALSFSHIASYKLLFSRAATVLTIERGRTRVVDSIWCAKRADRHPRDLAALIDLEFRKRLLRLRTLVH